MRAIDVLGIATMAYDAARDAYHRTIVDDAPSQVVGAARERLRHAGLVYRLARDWQVAP